MIWMQGCRSRAIDNVPVKAFHADLCSLTSSRFRPWIDQRSQRKITLGGHRSRLDARPSMFDGSQVQSTQGGSSGLDGFLEFQRQRLGRATHNDHIRGSSILYAFEQGRSLLITDAQASCNVVAEAGLRWMCWCSKCSFARTIHDEEPTSCSFSIEYRWKATRWHGSPREERQLQHDRTHDGQRPSEVVRRGPC